MADGQETAEIILPGVTKEYLAPAIRLIYTGTLKLTGHELKKTYKIWYVNYILKTLLNYDINTTLADDIPIPPEAEDFGGSGSDDDDDGPPAPPGRPSSSANIPGGPATPGANQRNNRATAGSADWYSSSYKW